jgi:hypothetical protein
MTLQAPRDPSFTVNFETGTATIFCYLPSREQINTRLAGMAASGQMQQVLTQMGAGGSSSGVAAGGTYIGEPPAFYTWQEIFADPALRSQLPQIATGSGSGGLTSSQIESAFRVFLDEPEIGHLFTARAQTFDQSQLASGPFTHTLATGCLSKTDAEIVLLEIRRAMHAYLGLPAP